VRILVAGALSAALWAGEPLLEKQDLFTAGEEGYALYRIPGIVVTARGTVLAYCEARKGDRGDWGTIDILLRRSTDGGQTWGPRVMMAQVEGPHHKNPVALAQKLARPEDKTYNNPVAIVDRKTSAVHFLFNLEYMRAFHMRSDDDGQTFSKPVEITGTFEEFRRDYDWKVLATGPGHGIQLSSGRLLVPVWLSTGTGGHAHRPSVVSVIYSDDHGRTWKRGDIAVPNTTDWINPSETVPLELADGRVMFNARSESKAHRRLIIYSRDGATGWSKPQFHPELLEPICMASAVRLSKRAAQDRNRILFANPDNLTRADGKETPGAGRDRRNLTVKLSYDEGATWPVMKPLEPGLAGYSDLAVGHDGKILCLYERGGLEGSAYKTQALALARFNLEWLTDGKDLLRPARRSAR
jgi:sialidase-1